MTEITIEKMNQEQMEALGTAVGMIHNPRNDGPIYIFIEDYGWKELNIENEIIEEVLSELDKRKY